MITAMSYRTNYDLSSLKLLALLLIVIAALPLTAMLATAITPLVVLALPVVAKLAVGAACIVAFGLATKPA